MRAVSDRSFTAAASKADFLIEDVVLRGMALGGSVYGRNVSEGRVLIGSISLGDRRQQG